MRILKPNPEVAPYGLSALKMIANSAETGFQPAHLAMLTAAQKTILDTNIDIEELGEITPEILCQHLKKPELRRQLIQGMIVLSLINGPASSTQIELIAAFAKAFKVDEPAIKVIKRLANKEMLLFRLDFMRRSHVKSAMESQYRTQGGLKGVIKGILGLKGIIEDKALAGRFIELGQLPEDTLGNTFFRHYRDHSFPFPGEKGGFPVAGAYHDFAHVLSGYTPAPKGEILVGGFQAGFRKTENDFFIVLFVVLTFSSGFNMTPVKQDKHVGLLGEGDMFEQLIRAINRGAAMNVDLGDDWDFWSDVELTMKEARAKMNVPE